MHTRVVCFFFFFFNDTATTEIYTLSLHDALPICDPRVGRGGGGDEGGRPAHAGDPARAGLRRPRRRADPAQLHPGVRRDRKSTRLNSSHANISYAVFCLKKKKHKT